MRRRSFAGATIEHQSGHRRGHRRPPGGRRRCGAPLVVGGADDAEVAARLRAAGRRGVGRARARPGRTRPRPGGRGGAGRNRLRRRGRPRGQGGQGGAGAAGAATRPCGRCCAPRASSSAAAPPGKVAFLYTGQGSQYVNMLARAAPARAVGRRDVRRGRPGHGAAAGQAADRVHLRRHRRRGHRATARPAADADRDHPAGGADHRPGADRLLDAYGVRAGHGDGPQPRRVRRAGRRRCAVASTPRWRRSAPGAARWRAWRWATTAPWRPCSPRWPRSSASSPRPTGTSSSPTSTAPARPSSAAPPTRWSGPSRRSRRPA